MADIGLAQPELKYPIGEVGAEFVLDPVMGYDAALAKSLPRSSEEYVYYQKGRALWKKGQYLEAYRLLSDLLKRVPQTPYRAEIVHTLKTGALTLVHQYQQSGDHLSAANIFLQAKKAGAITAEDLPVLLKASVSLAYLGLYDEAVQLVTPLKKAAPKTAQAEIDRTLAELEKVRPSDVPQGSKDREKWELFESGRAYLHTNDLPQAEEALNQLKGDGGEPFWSKVSEYAIEEGKWSQKYRRDAKAGRPTP
jgi:tetratricopeptide (TPR) repeat protein